MLCQPFAQAIVSKDDESGASSVEYSLLVFAIAAAITVIAFVVGDVVVDLFAGSCTEFESQAATGATC